MVALVKIVGTLAVVALLSLRPGLFAEAAGRPPAVSLAVVAVFLGLVAWYCRTLQRTLALVRPEARAAAPASVWWMFAIPYNFVEDFFIVHAVAASLARDGGIGGRAVRRWSAFGYGWCGLQILSLLPGAVGYAGGAGALLLWAVHWPLTLRINRRLGAGTAAAR